MRIESKYLFIFVLFIFSTLNFVYAVPPVTTVSQFTEGYKIVESQQQYLKLEQDFQYNLFVYNYSSGILLDNSTIMCRFYLSNSSGEIIYNSNMTFYADKHWGVEIDGNNFSQVGIYPYGVSCQDGYGGALSGDWEVTIDGNEANIERLISNIILFLSICCIMFIIGYKNKRTDYDSWGDKIINNHKNMGQTMASGIVLSLFKNTFIWYYFFGWLLVLILKNIIYGFGSLEIYSYFVLIANIYSLGFLLVIVYMIGYTITYIRGMVNILTDNSWGVGN